MKFQIVHSLWHEESFNWDDPRGQKSAYGRSTITRGGKGEAIIQIARYQIEIGNEGDLPPRCFAISSMWLTTIHELIHIALFRLCAHEKFHAFLEELDRRGAEGAEWLHGHR